MNNMINSGSLSTLKAGNSLLVHARRVQGGKLQLELAEVITSSDASPNLISMFNKSDSRFSQQGARRAWQSVEPTDASELLGIDLSDSNPGWMTDDRGREILPLNILNPSVGGGSVLRVRVSETTVPTPYQASNLETEAKRKGRDGDFILHKGQYIFSNTEFALSTLGGTVDHVLLEADAAPAAGVTQTQATSSPFTDINS